MTKNRTILIFLLLFAGFSVKSQTDSTSIILLQEVVVTSLRAPQKQVLIPYSVNCLTPKLLENFNPRTTPEALMNMTGVFVQKTNHGGGSPFIRGLTGNQTLLLIDGIRLNNSIYRYGPNQYLNTIDAFSVDQIEVAKGTGSVQYGTDAIGGVLQVFTKEPLLNDTAHIIHGRVFGKYMTGDMEKSGRGEIQYSSPRMAGRFGATYRNFGDIIGGKNTGKQSPSGYNEFAVDTKIMFALKSNIQLTIANQLLKQQHVPLYHKVVLENYLLNEFDQQQRMLSYARLNIHGNRKIIDQLKIIASWQQSLEGRSSQKNGSTLLINEKDEVNTLGLTLDISSELNQSWTANSGIEIYRDRVGSIRNERNTASTSQSASNRGLYPDNSKYGNYSLYTLHHFNFRKWTFDGGMRFNAFRIELSDITLGKVNIAPEALVFNGAIMYNINLQNHLYGNFSSGFRAPNIDDMGTLGIVDFRYELPTYDLTPEKSQNYELGYKFQLTKFNGTVSVYYMNLDHLIARVIESGKFIDGYQVYKKQNVDDAYIRGFEAAMNWNIFHDWEINSGVSYTYGQSISKHEPLRRIPPFNGRMSATHRHGRLTGTAEFLFAFKQDRLAQGDKSDNRIPKGGTPGWKVVNIYSGYQVGALKYKIGLQNILNEDYRTHGSGINGVGRSAWLSVDYTF